MGWMGLVLGVPGALGIAWASDDLGEEIRIGLPEEFVGVVVDLAAVLEIDPWPHWGHSGTHPPQLWDGLVSLQSGGDIESLSHRGWVVTTKSGDQWTESWFVREPEVVANHEVQELTSLPWPGTATFDDGVSLVHQEDDANDYALVQSTFVYNKAPDRLAVEAMSNIVPGWFGAQALQYEVFSTHRGTNEQVGALYRIYVPPDIIPASDDRWIDSWALWGNFEIPAEEDAAGALRLELVSQPTATTLKAFFLEQHDRPTGESWSHLVHTSTSSAPVP